MLHIKFGRARRGGSGALNLQPAKAGSNTCPRPLALQGLPSVSGEEALVLCGAVP